MSAGTYSFSDGPEHGIQTIRTLTWQMPSLQLSRKQVSLELKKKVLFFVSKG